MPANVDDGDGDGDGDDDGDGDGDDHLIQCQILEASLPEHTQLCDCCSVTQRVMNKLPTMQDERHVTCRLCSLSPQQLRTRRYFLLFASA